MKNSRKAWKYVLLVVACLLLFAGDCCCCLLLLDAACCCLLRLVAACCCLLRLLLLAVACCCLLLLAVACCCLLLLAACMPDSADQYDQERHGMKGNERTLKEIQRNGITRTELETKWTNLMLKIRSPLRKKSAFRPPAVLTRSDTPEAQCPTLDLSRFR